MTSFLPSAEFFEKNTILGLQNGEDTHIQGLCDMRRVGRQELQVSAMNGTGNDGLI